MEGGVIYNLGNPTLAGYAVTKGYADDQAKKLLKLDGARAMTGNLNMGDNATLGVRSSSADNSVITVGGAKATYLPLSGDRSMQGDLNMGNNAILGVRRSSANNSVITVGGAKATYLPLNGENVTQGDLKMNNHDINKIKKSRS